MNLKTILLLCFLTTHYSNCFGQKMSKESDSRPLMIVLIMDGLRPDAITQKNMPNLFKLQQEGVKFTNSHASIPTVTRVNSASLASGSYPEAHGIMSNSIYLKEVNPTGSVSTGNYKNLMKVDSVSNGKLLYVKTIGEILQQNNLQYVAISSGSTGSAYLLNHKVYEGVGTLINSQLNNGNDPAIPYIIGEEIIAQFGNPPTKNGDLSYNPSVDWVENILYEYVLPKMEPDVIYNWFTEPDHSQHRFGTGSKEYYKALKNNDKHVGLLLKKLKELGLYERVNIIVTSDHGMNEDVQSINLKESCKNAEINPDDFIIASSGETLLLHVKDHDKIKIKRIVEHLQSKNWVGAIFTEASSEIGQKEELVNPYGFIEGTFSLDLIRANHPERKADIIFNFYWSSKNNDYGISGSSFKNTSGKPLKLDAGGGHGNISPACINNTLIAWGANFKTSVKINNPSGIVDITPTVLNILKIKTDGTFDGRILEEALINGIDPQKIIIESKTYTVQTKDKKYKAAVQISIKDRHWYVDKGWRTYKVKHDE